MGLPVGLDFKKRGSRWLHEGGQEAKNEVGFKSKSEE